MSNSKMDINIFRHETFKSLMERLERCFNALEEENALLRAHEKKTYEELREEFADELKCINERSDKSPIIFSELENEKYKAFIKKHYELHRQNINGISLHLAGNGIGTCIELECPVCHEKEDITDVMSW